MRLLADENVPAVAVEHLRQRGHDIAWIRADMRGADDEVVIGRAVAERRILLTFDKDFGYLAFRLRVPASCGIVLFRIPPSSPTDVARTAVAVLESRSDWGGHFSVIEESRIRMTRLPWIANSTIVHTGSPVGKFEEEATVLKEIMPKAERNDVRLKLQPPFWRKAQHETRRGDRDSRIGRGGVEDLHGPGPAVPYHTRLRERPAG
jgi:predicted nuclease of predicted toxin-antitoxin system